MFDIAITTMNKKRPDGKTTYLGLLLESIKKTAPADLEYKIHIVSNVSPYAAAVNKVLQECHNDTLLLNDDIIMLPGREQILDGYGDIRGFLLLYPDKITIQHAGASFDGEFCSRHVGQYSLNCGQFQVVAPMPYVTFGAVFLKAGVYEALGPITSFSKIFFEDADYCLRAWKAGYKVIYHPIELIHDEAATMGKGAWPQFQRKWRSAETIDMLREKIMEAWFWLKSQE